MLQTQWISLIFTFLIVGVAGQSVSANLRCTDIYIKPYRSYDRLQGLAEQASKRSYGLEAAIRKGHLLEAHRMADRLGLIDLKYGIDKALRYILQNSSVKNNPIELLDVEQPGVYLVELEAGVKAIFTADSQFQGLRGKEFLTGVSHSSSMVAKYQLARILGLDLVPMTVVREVNGEKGMLQAFVGSTPLAGSIRNNHKDLLMDLADLYIFDFLTRNSGRAEDNLLYNSTGLWEVNRGVPFYPNRLSIQREYRVESLGFSRMSLVFIANLKATTPLVIREVLKDYPDQSVVEEVILRRQLVLGALGDSPVSLH